MNEGSTVARKVVMQFTSLYNLEIDWALVVNHKILPGESKYLETVRSFQIFCLLRTSSSTSDFIQKLNGSIAIWVS